MAPGGGEEAGCVEDGGLADGESGIEGFEVGVVVGGGAGGEGDVGLGGGGVPDGGGDLGGVGFVAGRGAVAEEALEEGVGAGEAGGTISMANGNEDIILTVVPEHGTARLFASGSPLLLRRRRQENAEMV